MNRLIISAPFGNWLNFPGATSTLGTFTRHYRGGFWYRLWRCLRTLRYSRKTGGWVNKLGLPNPGIDSLDGDIARGSVGFAGKVVSIHGFSPEEWIYLAQKACRRGLLVEFNLSCPNVGHRHVAGQLTPVFQRFNAEYAIAKLPPLRWFELAEPLYDLGVRCFHLCNTLPCPGGGLSGKVLKPYSLWAVEEFRKRWGGRVELIGGGGVTCEQDVRDYLSAGADRVAVGSMLLNPFNHRKIPGFVRLLEDHFGGQYGR